MNEISPRQTTEECLYLVSLNQLALQLSPYNFDIVMWQCKLYDQLHMSVSFVQAHQDLGLKGVQLESLGYLQLRHTLHNASYDSMLKPVLTKYKKYESLNHSDLQKLKLKTFDDDNYEQIENFVEYEAYLQQSYFARV